MELGFGFFNSIQNTQYFVENFFLYVFPGSLAVCLYCVITGKKWNFNDLTLGCVLGIVSGGMLDLFNVFDNMHIIKIIVSLIISLFGCYISYKLFLKKIYKPNIIFFLTYMNDREKFVPIYYNEVLIKKSDGNIIKSTLARCYFDPKINKIVVFKNKKQKNALLLNMDDIVKITILD